MNWGPMTAPIEIRDSLLTLSIPKVLRSPTDMRAGLPERHDGMVTKATPQKQITIRAVVLASAVLSWVPTTGSITTRATGPPSLENGVGSGIPASGIMQRDEIGLCFVPVWTIASRVPSRCDHDVVCSRSLSRLLPRRPASMSCMRQGGCKYGTFMLLHDINSREDEALSDGEAGECESHAAVDGSARAAASVERALERRRRSRETPLSQKWFKQKQKIITPAQKRSLRDHWPAYGVEVRHGEVLDPDAIFGRSAHRRVLDIGFGTGDSIAGMASEDPDADFVGVELHKASIATALADFDERGLISNVRVVRHDVAVLLREHMRGEAFSEAYILFPDPWPGPRDEQRRVLRKGTAALLAERMRPGGVLRIATDVEAYAEHVKSVMAAASHTWRPCSEVVYAAGTDGGMWGRPRTRYERRAAELGHSVFEFEYAKL